MSPMNIYQKIADLENRTHQLLLIVGQPGSGKSKLMRKFSEETRIPIIDLDHLFVLTPASQLLSEMKKFLSTYQHDVLLLDNKKILYAKDSGIDLLAFLKEISKDIKVVATWNGIIEDGQIFHFCKDADEDLIYSVQKEDFLYIRC